MDEPKGGRRAALLLAVVALRVPAGVRTQTPVPVPWAAGALGLVAGFGYLALLFPFGGR
ncbi:hypothetical protein [Nonomuraea sp. NPDC049504]|uniref:hypothetical protein n=1 Tax=Nonomuraea sp. NPDC049504 TaxID=3154729 RepID=UPI0034298503